LEFGVIKAGCKIARRVRLLGQLMCRNAGQQATGDEMLENVGGAVRVAGDLRNFARRRLRTGDERSGEVVDGAGPCLGSVVRHRRSPAAKRG
jgi:hypothetical protein